jgi:hypothetical protein
METIPGWLVDAVAAAGLATAYAHHYDALIEEGVKKAEAPPQAGASH